MNKHGYYVAIGIEGKDTMMKQTFDVPPNYWDRWFTVSFQFRKGSDIKTANMSVVPNKMIWVKERWFHRVWNWIYWKFKKPSDEVGQA